MATFYTDQTNVAQGANPLGEMKATDFGGRVRVITASVNPTAAQVATDVTLVGTLPAGARFLRGDYLVTAPMPTSFNIGTLCASALYGIMSCSSSSSGVFVAFAYPQAGSCTSFLNASVSSATALAKTCDTAGKKETTLYLKSTATVSTAGSLLLALYYVID